MTIRRERIDELLEEGSDPKQPLAEGGFLKQLTVLFFEEDLHYLDIE